MNRRRAAGGHGHNQAYYSTYHNFTSTHLQLCCSYPVLTAVVLVCGGTDPMRLMMRLHYMYGCTVSTK